MSETEAVLFPDLPPSWRTESETITVPRALLGRIIALSDTEETGIPALDRAWPELIAIFREDQPAPQSAAGALRELASELRVDMENPDLRSIRRGLKCAAEAAERKAAGTCK
ncbi:MAG: hypothetical protein ACLQFR_07640 [Streptosporangiaceae bacterium]